MGNFKKSKKYVAIALVGALSLGIFTGCGGNSPADKGSMSVIDANDGDSKTNEKSSALTSAVMDTYNDNVSSTHIASVLYNPDINYQSNDSDLYNKYILCSYGMGREFTMDELVDFSFLDDKNDLMWGVDGIIINSCITHGSLNSPTLYLNRVTGTELVDEVYISTGTAREGYAEERGYVTCDDGYMDTADINSRFFMYIDSTAKGDERVRAAMEAETPLSREEINSENLANIINNQLYNGDLYILNSLDDFTSVEETFGSDNIKLDDAVFVQDVYARKIQKLFGLNIRDRESFIHSEYEYILYCDDENRVRVTFLEADYMLKNDMFENDDNSYNTLSDGSKDSFMYTDKDGNKFEYFLSSETYGMHHDKVINVFKNKELIGGIAVSNINEELTLFEELNLVFGTNN